MEQRAEEDAALGWALAQGFGRLSPLQTRARQRSGKEELGRLRGAADFERREGAPGAGYGDQHAWALVQRRQGTSGS